VIWRRLFVLVALIAAFPAAAEQLMMVRAERPYPEAMNLLQESIRQQGYVVTRVQRVDVGLGSRGFKTAEYRVVFFGKAAEMKDLPERYPDLLPYLPLKIVIFAEGETTLALTYNPMMLVSAYPDKGLRAQVQGWERDLREILDRYGHSE
jgi:uncharacterized protein (DUF302 family)